MEFSGIAWSVTFQKTKWFQRFTVYTSRKHQKTRDFFMFSRGLYCRCWNHVLFTKFTDQNISENLNIFGCTICPAGNYMFKIKKRNTRARCEICSMLTIKTPERRQWRRSGVFIVNFEHISHLFLAFLLLTLNM